MSKIVPRGYQGEAINAVLSEPYGSKPILALAVGLGKSFTSALIIFELERILGRKVKALWLARQTALVYQPTKYFPNHSIGMEMGKHKSNGEDVIFSTVQTLHNRLDKFPKDYFDIIIGDEIQEGKGKQYSDVINYFDTKYTVGLSGTPFRLDGQKLTDNLFDRIVYQKDIKWGIENGYLCNVDAVRCFIDFDLSGVKSSGGDFNITDLEEAMSGTEDAIAEAYHEYSKGRPTLIFATGIDHAKAIAERIEGARVIIGDTPQEERDEIFNGFENEEIPCIVSVNVMTQGVDLPISTVGIFAKPTKSVGRYQQQVGRILRTHPKKDRALIVDCIGVSNLGLCTAPSILGINMDLVPEERHDEVEGDLMEMEELIEVISDTPTSWIRNAKHVKLWAKENKVKTNQVNYLLTPKGEMVVSLPERVKVSLPPPDMLGNIDATKIKGLSPELHKWGLEYYGDTWELQRGLDAIHHYLARNYGEQDKLWDLKKVRSWGKKPATPAQIAYLMRRLKGDVPNPLTRGEAAQILQMLDLRK